MMRDGPEETVVTSMVEVVEVGQDSAGKILTSLVVKPGETPVGGHTKGEWTGALKTFRKALSEALLETDEKIHVNGFVTRAADLEQVRKHYYTTCVADGATQEEKQDTRRKRFLRCVERAQQANLIGVRVEPNGRTLLWLPHPEPQKEEM
jgi:hypothetical protein